VAYFIDLFANHFDPQLAESAVSVLLRAGVNVYVPTGQRGSGMASLVVGDLDRTRQLVTANLRILGNAVRDGYTVVCSEPTAALMLTRLGPKLTDDLDAALVADRTMDLGHYLKGLQDRGGLPDPTVAIAAKAGYHQPCHLRALGVGTPGLDLVRTIPGLEVEFIDRGCSGIAGVFGLARKNFRTSLRSGRDLRSRLKDPDIQFGVTECGTCRMQMEQGLTKRTVHPIKLLAIAHGMLPELRATLTAPKPRHEMS
jgi:Fe-S oxidoreductase